MEQAQTTFRAPLTEQKIRAKKMLLTFALFTIVMMFAALISAYIVMRNASPFWVNINMPSEFWVSTVIILLSSATIHFALKFLEQGKKQISLILTVLTLVMGIAFCAQQYNGFLKLSSLGMPFTGNGLMHLSGEYGQDYYITNKDGARLSYINEEYYVPNQNMSITEEVLGNRNTSASYFNGLVILHAIHVGGGILALIIVVLLTVIGVVKKERPILLSQVSRYWHFVDGLWIFLLLFLYLIH